MGMEIEGLDKVLRNLNKEIKGIENRSAAGLYRAGLMIQKTSDKKVPVDNGDLKASSYVDEPRKFGREIGVKLGYGVSYAVYVHEALGILKGQPRPKGRGRFWDPQGMAQPQFLRNALTEKSGTVLAIIQKYAKIRK